MAPEVLLGKPFNEKADVYSFGKLGFFSISFLFLLLNVSLGIVLWEIVERTDPFSNFRYAFLLFIHCERFEESC